MILYIIRYQSMIVILTLPWIGLALLFGIIVGVTKGMNQNPILLVGLIILFLILCVPLIKLTIYLYPKLLLTLKINS